MDNFIVLNGQTFRALSPSAQSEILAAFGRQERPSEGTPEAPTAGPPAHEGLARLTEAQVFRLVRGLSPATVNTLKAIAELNPEFRYADLLAKLNAKPQDLVGQWSGVTRRTRKITGNPKAGLAYGHGEKTFVDPVTHAGLRRVLLGEK